MSGYTLSASTVDTIYNENMRQYEGGLISTAKNARVASKLDTPMNWFIIIGNGVLGFAGLFLITYFALGPLGVIGVDGVFHIHVPAMIFGVLGMTVCVMSCTLPAKLARMKSKAGKRNVLGACALAIIISLGTGLYAGMVIFDLAENNGQDAQVAQDARADGLQAVRGLRDSAKSTLDMMKNSYQSSEQNIRVLQERVEHATRELSDWKSITLAKFGQGSAAANSRLALDGDGIPTHSEHRGHFDAIASAKAERDAALANREGLRIEYQAALDGYKRAAKVFESKSEDFAGSGFKQKISASDSIGRVFGITGDTVNFSFMTIFTIVLAFVPILINYGDGKESEPALEKIAKDKEVEALKRRIAQMTMTGQQRLESGDPAILAMSQQMDAYKPEPDVSPVAAALSPPVAPTVAHESREPITVTHEEKEREDAREILRFGDYIENARRDASSGKLESASVKWLSDYRVGEGKAGPEGARAIQKALVADGYAEWLEFANRTECRLLKGA